MSTDDDNTLIAERREKLAALRVAATAAGSAAFPNDFKPTQHAAELLRLHGDRPMRCWNRWRSRWRWAAA